MSILTSYSQSLSSTQIKRINLALVDCIKTKELLKNQEDINANLLLTIRTLESALHQSDSLKTLKIEEINIYKDSLTVINNKYTDLNKKYDETTTKLSKEKARKRKSIVASVLLATYEVIRITLKL